MRALAIDCSPRPGSASSALSEGDRHVGKQAARAPAQESIQHLQEAVDRLQLQSDHEQRVFYATRGSLSKEGQLRADMKMLETKNSLKHTTTNLDKARSDESGSVKAGSRQNDTQKQVDDKTASSKRTIVDTADMGTNGKVRASILPDGTPIWEDIRPADEVKFDFTQEEIDKKVAAGEASEEQAFYHALHDDLDPSMHILDLLGEERFKEILD